MYVGVSDAQFVKFGNIEGNIEGESSTNGRQGVSVHAEHELPVYPPLSLLHFPFLLMNSLDVFRSQVIPDSNLWLFQCRRLAKRSAKPIQKRYLKKLKHEPKVSPTNKLTITLLSF